MNLRDMTIASTAIIKALDPDSDRIQVAGSIRRLDESPGDIDIVLIPKEKRPPISFGQKYPVFRSTLELSLWELCQSGRMKTLAGGEKYKKFELDLGAWGCDFAIPVMVKLQVTIATPLNWAYWYLIRTGPAGFSRAMVTPKSQGGAIPEHMAYHEFGLWQNGEQIKTLDESDWLIALGLPYIPPPERNGWKIPK